jgi:hypothetical protein
MFVGNFNSLDAQKVVRSALRIAIASVVILYVALVATPLRAEVPYLLADSNSSPIELDNPAVLGATMYVVHRDSDGTVYLLKMDPTDTAFQKVARVTEGTSPRVSLKVTSVGARLLIEASVDSVSSFFISDGSPTAPRPISLGAPASFEGIVQEKILFLVGEVNRKLVAFAPKEFTSEELIASYGNQRLAILHDTEDRVLFSDLRDNSGHSEVQLWVTDGSQNGTVLLRAFTDQGSSARYLGSPGGKVYFTLNEKKIWRTDSSVSGTQLAFDLQSVSGPGITQLQRTLNSNTPFQSLGGNVVFLVNVLEIGDDGSGAGWQELWRMNGSPAGGAQIMDMPEDCFSADFDLIGNQILLVCRQANAILPGLSRLYSSDGTTAGTRLLLNVAGLVSIVGELRGGRRLLHANQDRGGALLITDGTAGNTRVIKDLISYGLCNLAKPGKPLEWPTNTYLWLTNRTTRKRQLFGRPTARQREPSP